MTTAVARPVARPDHGGAGGPSMVGATSATTGGAGSRSLTGFVEPVLYLFSIGVGVGALIHGFTVHGRDVELRRRSSRPAMLAASAMNGALLDSTFNIFFKLKFDKLYDAVLATPMTPATSRAASSAGRSLRGASTPPCSCS